MQIWKTLALVVPLGILGGFAVAKGLDPVMLERGDDPLKQTASRLDPATQPIPPVYNEARFTSSPRLNYRPDLDYDAFYPGPDVSTLLPPDSRGSQYPADFPAMRTRLGRESDYAPSATSRKIIDAADRAEAAVRDVMEAAAAPAQGVAGPG